MFQQNILYVYKIQIKTKKTITITITTITTGQQKMISLCCTHLKVYFLLVLVVHVTNLLSDHQNHGT